MPLPDAKPSTRIYELLKNTDLENITFSQFQGVAEKIFAEQGAEDELRRIVLVNLARLSVVGEWTGLTSAGAAGVDYQISELPGAPSNLDTFTIARDQIYGANRDLSTTHNISNYNYPNCYPFVAPKTGTLNEIQVQVAAIETGGATFKIGIYDSTDTNLPNALLGYGDFTFASTGVETQTSLSATISVEAGKLYWYTCVIDAASTGGQVQAYGINGYNPSLGIGTSASDQNKMCLRDTSSVNALPDPFSIVLGGTEGGDPRPLVGIVIA